MTVNERIRQRRIELGLSVDDIASKLNKNRATIYRYESEEIAKLPLNILEPLAAALHTTPAFLMGWESVIPTLDPDVQELATQIQKLDAEDRAEIRGEVRGMLRADKYKQDAADTA